MNRLDKPNCALSLRQAQDSQAQHERDLPFPFALSLSKGKSTRSDASMRLALVNYIPMEMFLVPYVNTGRQK